MKRYLLVEKLDKHEVITTNTKITLVSRNIAEQERVKKKLIEKYGQPNQTKEEGGFLNLYYCVEDVDSYSLKMAFMKLDEIKNDFEMFLTDTDAVVSSVTFSEDLECDEVRLDLEKEEGCCFSGNHYESLIHYAKVTIKDYKKGGLTVRNLYKHYKDKSFDVLSAYDHGVTAELELVRDGSSYADSLHAIGDSTSEAVDEVLNATPEVLREQTKISLILTTNF